VTDVTEARSGAAAGFIRGLLTLAAGGALAQMISLAAAPIISSLYSPEAFGNASLFLAAVGLFSGAGCLRYEQAVIVARDDARAVSLARISLLSLCGIVVVVGLGTVLHLVLSPDSAVGVRLGGWLYVLPIGIGLAVLPQIGLAWHTRRAQFRRVSQASAITSLGTASARIGFGLLGWTSPAGLILGQFAGQLVQSGVLFRREHGGLGPPWDVPAAREPLSRIAREYRDFPIYAAPTALLNSFSSQALGIFAMSWLFEPEIVGLFAWADRILRQPVLVVSTALRRAFIQRAADLWNRGESFNRLYVLTTLGVFVAGLPAALLLIFWGAEIFAFVFGDEWRESGSFGGALSPWLVSIAALPAAHASFIVLRWQRAWMGFQVLLTVARIGVFVLAALLGWSALRTVWTFSFVSFGMLLAVMLWMLHAIPRPGGGVSGQGASPQ
jgi:O-antigen/teichoic acid export membrane protein